MEDKIPEEWQEYGKTLKIFERLIEIAVTISDASGGINTSRIAIEATKIFTRLTLSSMTIDSLLPENKVTGKTLWDFPSIAALSRTFIETSHRYLYLAEQNLDEAEEEFRLKLFYFHLNSEKYRLYKEIDSQHEILKEFESILPTVKKEIEKSEIFKNLSKYIANKIKTGYMDIHFTDKAIAKRFSLVGDSFKPIYRLLSNHSHGSPFATYSQSNIRGRGIENKDEKFYINLATQLLNQYLSLIIIFQVELLNLHKISPKGLKFAKSIFEDL